MATDDPVEDPWVAYSPGHLEGRILSRSRLMIYCIWSRTVSSELRRPTMAILCGVPVYFDRGGE